MPHIKQERIGKDPCCATCNECRQFTLADRKAGPGKGRWVRGACLGSCERLFSACGSVPDANGAGGGGTTGGIVQPHIQTPLLKQQAVHCPAHLHGALALRRTPLNCSVATALPGTRTAS